MDPAVHLACLSQGKNYVEDHVQTFLNSLNDQYKYSISHYGPRGPWLNLLTLFCCLVGPLDYWRVGGRDCPLMFFGEGSRPHSGGNGIRPVTEASLLHGNGGHPGHKGRFTRVRSQDGRQIRARSQDSSQSRARTQDVRQSRAHTQDVRNVQSPHARCPPVMSPHARCPPVRSSHARCPPV